MKIAITGTRGIPNQYGGFEQFAMKLAEGLASLGHNIIVYNPHWHPYKDNTYQGVEIIHKWFPEMLAGSVSNYFYDYSCLKDSYRREVDVILECGYASAAPWYPWLRKDCTKLITHMDGMERDREKWGSLVKWLFLCAEKQAIRFSDALVCDHPEIAKYYLEKYSLEIEMIPYGAVIGEKWDTGMLQKYGLNPGEYYLLAARLEPDNKIRMIIEGFLASDAPENLAVVGSYKGKYGKALYREFGKNGRLKFLGAIYENLNSHNLALDNLRHFSKAVIHGHSVGGTNPSLLEAMAAGATIIAHENVYNRWVLGDNARYFSSSSDITDLITGVGSLEAANESDQKRFEELRKIEEPEEYQKDETLREFSISNNLKRIREDFQWIDVVRMYEELFLRLTGS